MGKKRGGSLHYVNVQSNYRFGNVKDVKIAFYNDKNLRSREIMLDQLMKNGSKGDESGTKFSVELGRNFGSIVNLEIWRNADFVDDDDEWYCELIKIRCVSTRRKYLFPVNRWILPGRRYQLKEHDMTLPHPQPWEEAPQQRKLRATLPNEDEQTLTMIASQFQGFKADKLFVAMESEYGNGIQEKSVQLPKEGQYKGDEAYGFPKEIHGEDGVMSDRALGLQFEKNVYVPMKHKETNMIMCKSMPRTESFPFMAKVDFYWSAAKLKMEAGFLNITARKWKSLKEIENIMYHSKALPVPAGMKNWKSDKAFGNQRLTGCNPTQIRLCTNIPESFAVKGDELMPLMEGLKIAEALDMRRLFLIDYTFLKDLPCTGGRRICAPKALFFVNRKKELMPIAIQLFPEPGPDNPVFYPSDPEYTWLMAKCHFNCADASVHQSATHLGFTHLLGEGIVIATHRCLSKSHPIFRLLAPHFLYLIQINKLAVSSLVAEDGWVDTTMQIGRIGMFEIIKRKWAEWRLDVEGSLLADLEQRGVADPQVLPNYHYRDDAVILRSAIYDYVKRIVYFHFDTPEKVTQDGELQEWGRFLGGKPKDENELTIGMKGLHNGGQFRTPEQVTDTVTNFIFILSAGHAAANFGQYEQYAFPPNYPASMHGDPPNNKNPLTEDDIIKQLPHTKETLDVMVITRLLSSRETNSLGYFEKKYIYDTNGVDSADTLRTELTEIGKMIDQRNKERVDKYTHLHPCDVPNAISV